MKFETFNVEPACVHCRRLNGHEPTCPTTFEHAVQHPCTRGLHRWAWLTAGGQACGVCGVPRR